MRKTRSYNQWISVAIEKDVLALTLLASKLSARARRQLLAAMEQRIDKCEISTEDRTQVAIAKLLIALVPESWKVIRALLENHKRSYLVAEIQFSLFCFLDELPCLPGGRALVSEAAALVGHYLWHADSDTARATWMAGDLLGDHWVPREGVPILIDVLANGRFAEGRLAALHGLEHAIDRVEPSEALADAIIRTVKDAATGDRSSRVRDLATCILDGVSGCRQPQAIGRTLRVGRTRLRAGIARGDVRE